MAESQKPTVAPFNWDRDAPVIFDRYFDQDGQGRVTVDHHLSNFNDLLETSIPNVVSHQNPIQIYGQRKIGEKEEFVLLYELNFKDVHTCLPIIRDEQETVQPLSPSHARLRGLTYASPMFVDVERKIYDPSDPEKPADVKLEQRIPLCNFPIMLHSRYCHLHNADSMALKTMGENMYDVGGYFIINGSEKVIIPQERPCDNRIMTFQGKSDKSGDIVEIKASIDQLYNPISAVRIRLSSEGEDGRHLLLKTGFLNAEVNLFVFFRALGVLTDREILRMILGFNDPSEADPEELKLLLPTAMEVLTERRESEGQPGTGRRKVETVDVTIVNQSDALRYIAGLMNIHTEFADSQMKKGLGEEEKENALATHRIKYAREILARNFLPHMGRNFLEKAMFLGHMTKRLLDSVQGKRPFDDRDHYSNKRLDLSGILLLKIFRENFAKLVKDLKKNLNQLINRNQSNINSTDHCIRRVIQTGKIESSLKYALSTGDWSSGKSGIKPSSTVLGIAQVLQRLSFKGTISHLRRSQSPIEKEGGKLMAPHKLNNSQIGCVDPNETPEGQQVGLVKNMSSFCRISTSGSSASVMLILKTLGLIPLRRVDGGQIHTTVKVFVNGRWMGNTRDTVHAQTIYNNLRHYKRSRNPETGVSWNYEYREISVRTDGGRYIRPCYAVRHDPLTRHNYLNIALHWQKIHGLDWNSLIHHSDGIIEFLDSEESENSLIAVHPRQLNERITARWLGTATAPGDSPLAIPTMAEIRSAFPVISVQTEMPLATLGQLGQRLRLRAESDDPQISRCYLEGTALAYEPAEDGKGLATLRIQLDLAVGPLDKCRQGQRFRLGVLPGNYLRYTHCEISPIQWFGVLSTDIPFSDHNQSPRNCYQCSMGKQSVSLCVTNYNQRMDTAGTHVLCYPQRPLVSSWANKYYHLDKMPHGQQAIVGIASYTGYNQEDSVILNESAIQRGLYNSLYFKTFVSKENKRKSSTAEIEQFGIPNFQRTEPSSLKSGGRRRRGLGPDRVDTYAYRYLETDKTDPAWGLVRVGTKFEDLEAEEDVVMIGKFVRTREEHKAALKREVRAQAAQATAAANGEVAVARQEGGAGPGGEGSVGNGNGAMGTNSTGANAGTTVPAEVANDHRDKLYRDISTVGRPVSGSVIDKVIPSREFPKNIDAEGNKFAKVREACYRQPELGDKFASRSAQKGTTGMKYRQEDMPFTARGLTPNIIMNPHAIPSRMTIAQVLETVIAKAAVKTGRYVDCTAFADLDPTVDYSRRDYSVDFDDLPEYQSDTDPMAYYKQILQKFGFNEHGEEVMYNPQTGEQFKSTIFIGPTYYQRLKHMVQDKIHARATGPVKTTTRQPSDGRSRDGGFRLGEMERDCLISHGVSQLLKERLMDSADLFRVFVSKKEQNIVLANPEKGIYKYGQEDLNPEDVCEVQLPYAMNLFRSELTAMGIDVRLIPGGS